MQYLAYSQGPTSVGEAHRADFLEPGVDSLLQIKSNRIEIHTLEATGLRLALSSTVFGVILKTVPVRLPGTATCGLAVLTTDYTLFVVVFQDGQAKTLASHSVLERSASRSVDLVALLAGTGTGDGAATTKFLVVHAFQGLVRVILLEEDQQRRRASKSGKEDTIDLSRGFTTRVPELLLNSMILLPPSSASSPPRLATIHTDRHGQRIFQLHLLNLSTKSIEIEDPELSSLPGSISIPKSGMILSDPDSGMLVPVLQNPKVSGVIVVGQDTARFVHTGRVSASGSTVPGMASITEKPLTEEPEPGNMDVAGVEEIPTVGKGKGKAREPPSPIQTNMPGSIPTSSTRRRSSASSHVAQLAISPSTTTQGFGAIGSGNKRKLSESANSSGRGKAMAAREDRPVRPVECSLPISDYVAYCPVETDPDRYLLVDGWGHAMYLKLTIESPPSPAPRRKCLSQSSPSTASAALATSPASPAKMATSPNTATVPASPRARRASRTSISSGSSAERLPNVKLSIEPIKNGRISSPSCLVNLGGGGFIFIGSHYGDSLLVRLKQVENVQASVVPESEMAEGDELDMDLDNEPPAPADTVSKSASAASAGTELEILNTYTNLAPIVDFCVVETGEGSGKGGPSHLVTCSGGRDDGTLRIVRHGVGMTELASLDMEGLQRIWALSSGSGKSEVQGGREEQDLLVLSYVNETRVLAFSAAEEGEGGEAGIEELDMLGSFDFSQPTLLAYSRKTSSFQVTANGVFGTSSRWRPASRGKITLADACEGYILLAVAGGEICLLQIGDEGGLNQVASQMMPNEVACLDISKLILSSGSSTLLVAVGLWNVYSVITMSVPDLAIQETIKLDTNFLLRSVMSATLKDEESSSSSAYLFIGLGDGTLVSYSYTTSREGDHVPVIDGNSKKTLALGSRPITMSKIQTAGNAETGIAASPAVFIVSDRSTIVSLSGSSGNAKLDYSSVNLKDVSSVSSFNNSSYPTALVLSSPSSLQIGRIDELQKLHVKTLRLGEEAPRRIVHSRKMKAYGVVFLKETLDRKTGEVKRSSSFKVLDETTFDVLADFPLDVHEEARSVACLSLSSNEDSPDYFVVGTGFIHPEEAEAKRGRVLVSEAAGEGVYTAAGEAETRGAVHAIAQLPEGRFAVTSNSEIIVYGWSAAGALEYLTSWGATFIAYNLAVKGDLLCAVDPLRSASMLRFDSSTNKLIDIAKEFSAYGLFAAAFLDKEKADGEVGEEGGETILAADLDLNLFTAKRTKVNAPIAGNSSAAFQGVTNEVETLKTQARIHVGEVVNKFCKGSLVPSFAQTSSGATPQLIFCTSVGSIGMISSLNSSNSQLLSAVERNMRRVIKGVGNLKQQDYRAFKTEYRTDPAVGFIDGSFVEELTNLSKEEVEMVMNGASEHERITEASKEDVVRLVEEMQRMH